MKEQGGMMELDRHLEPRPSETAIQHLVRPLPRVVALGGGTGLPILLRGLKEALFPLGWMWDPVRDRDRLTAIVTVADDGGSSGRLREAYRMPAPGDIRNCLLALSDGDPMMAALFDFRFNGKGEVGSLLFEELRKLDAGSWFDPQYRGEPIPTLREALELFASHGSGALVELKSPHLYPGIEQKVAAASLA